MGQTGTIWTAIGVFISIAALVYAVWNSNWRWFMIFCPVSIRIFDKPFYREWCVDKNGHRYNAFLDMEIITRVKTSVNSLGVKLTIDNKPATYKLFLSQIDENIGNTNIENYLVLHPEATVRRHTYTFSFMIPNGKRLDPKSYIVIEKGIRSGKWSIKKPFLLQLEV